MPEWTLRLYGPLDCTLNNVQRHDKEGNIAIMFLLCIVKVVPSAGKYSYHT